MEEIYVGIDVSKDRLDVHILPSNEAFSVERRGAGIGELCRKLLALKPKIVALEATGGFETIAAAALASAGLPIVVVNPAQVRAFAKALGKRAKTDPIDAEVIARFIAATRPEVRPLPDEATQILADLVARRRQIVEMLTAERQRAQRLEGRRHIAKSIAQTIAFLERQLASADGDIDDAMRSSPLWREKEDLLSSVPGIGSTIARTLVAELPELGSLNPKQAASLAGLAPFTRQSGKWKGKSFIGGGRKTVRSALFIGALSASRFNPVLRAFYLRLISAGKPKMGALIAVARKLIIALNAILRDKTPWQPQNA